MTNSPTRMERSALTLAKVTMFFAWLAAGAFALAVVLAVIVVAALIIN